MSKNKEQRKQLTAAYMEQERVIGVYEVTNTKNGRVFVGSSSNMNGAWSRARFELGFGVHPNKELQSDWKTYGADAFEFQVADQLKLKDKLRHDYKDVLDLTGEGEAARKMRDLRKDAIKLEEKWLELLREQGKNVYNK
ncbi:GIY-YIG nuclease family protein [Paenibacillus sp. NEAU-GSW1]|uniref:GIY-YIG nuclease family protein n=1 Tax=Paenibacillus sp. NEAU-GSW1 TaxID=2682486 RepID=UPI0020A697C9|nr:GIY-YIG nuclease family protein [Paenibacillus sp. NEAU-GSW1]